MRLGDASVEAVARHCAGTLRLLDLQGCARAGDPSALALAAVCGQLETVSFQCVPRLSDRGFAALWQGCPKLRHVTLKACDVTAHAVEAARNAKPDLVVNALTGPPKSYHGFSGLA